VTDALLAARHLSFTYGNGLVLTDVSFEVHAGEFVALVGPNGSGKSTLLRVLLGTLQATEGEAELLGQHPAQAQQRWRVGYVPQRARMQPDLPATVREVVGAGRLPRRGWWRRGGARDRTAVNEAIASVGLTDMAARRVRELSGGQQQRVLIAKALAGEPDVLILDEPVAGVDAESQRQFREVLVRAVRDHGAAVLLVSHELSAVADELDRVIVLKGRVMFDGTPAELRERGVSLGVHPDDLPFWLEALR